MKVKGHEAVRKIQNLLSNWKLELELWEIVEGEHTIEQWLEFFRAFALRNKDKSSEEVRAELIEFAKQVCGKELT